MTEPTAREDELERVSCNLERENAELRAYVKQLTEWELDGEALFKEKGLGVFFRIGAWWADRPWRDRTALK